MTRRENVRIAIAAAGVQGIIGVALVIVWVAGGDSIGRAVLAMIFSYAIAALVATMAYALVRWAMKP